MLVTAVRTGAGLAALIGVLIGFAVQAREFGITTDMARETFAFGPVVGTVRQTIQRVEPFLTGIDVRLRASNTSPAGVPVNLRLIDASGAILAESRVAVQETLEPTTHRLAFPPLTEGGSLFAFEIQRASEGAGSLTVPIHVGARPAMAGFVDHEGTLHADWAAHVSLFRTLRPTTYLRELASSDPLTAAGAAAAIVLVALAAFAGLRHYGVERPAALLLGAAAAVGAAWLGFALLPAV